MKQLQLLFVVTLASLQYLYAEVDKTPTQVEIVSVLTGFDTESAVGVESAQVKDIEPVQLPKVTTKDGNAAVIKMLREFSYPTDFDAEGTPLAFDIAHLGVVLTVKPYIVKGKIHFSGTLSLATAPERLSSNPKDKSIPAILSSKKIFSGKAKSGEKIEIISLSPLGEKTTLFLAFTLMDKEGKRVN